MQSKRKIAAIALLWLTAPILLSAIQDFVPLSCNSNLGSSSCVPWTAAFGSANEFATRLIVDCGTCITMNHPGPELTLTGGIDIRGKLVFPDAYSLTLRTAMITVQGELEMTSTSKAVDGTPLIRIVMIGSDTNQTFAPVGENSAACVADTNLSGLCKVGKKAITVAGGKVNLRGLPSATPTWVRLYDVAGGTTNNPSSILVANSVQGKWAVGAEILITAHTRDWNDHQVRTISGISVATTAGYVQLVLSSPIRRPTTLVESSDYAVEVALLSRNIVFEGGTTATDGGHLWILQTPKVPQTIEGIEVRFFGQQGTLGRYPIHFHFCNDVSGSVVSKNTIRQSHQRCVVVHGSNNLLIQDNVAYDTKGHCYMLEDGIETGNSFIRNLGAQTAAPATIISGNGLETDMNPATFWISNPTNLFEENVAAGSISSGYWFELRKRGIKANLFPDPIFQPLGSFRNNIAHSNDGTTGAFRMYPGGFLPDSANKAVFTGLKAYRNSASGIFIHKVQNFALTGSLFADNDLGVDIDRAEAIDVTDTKIIGKSSSYEALMAREPGVKDICSSQGKAIGLDLHTWKLRDEIAGVQIRNVDILGYGNINCRNKTAIHMDAQTLKQGLFELFTTFEKVSISDGAGSINFCDAALSVEPIDSIYLIDLDGSLRPSTSSVTGPSSLVSSGLKMLTFVDPAKCTEVAGRCYNYCKDTCFRSLRFEVNPSGTGNYKLKVCRRGDPSKCVLFNGGLRFNGNSPFGTEPRIFFAHLPQGNYDAVFLDESGTETWPSFVRQEFEAALCSGSVDVALRAPDTSAGYCTQMIRNGNADASSTEPLFWLTSGGLQVLPAGGMNGSNAVAGTKYGTTTLLQYVDTRCLKPGARLTITADIKLVTAIGNVIACNHMTENCPSVGVYAEGPGSNMVVAEVSAGMDGNGFQKVSGSFNVDASMNTSAAVYVFVAFTERNSNVDKRMLVVDNLSAVLATDEQSPVAAPVQNPVTSPVVAPMPVPVSVPAPVAPPNAAPAQVPVTPPVSNPVAVAGPVWSPTGVPVRQPTYPAPVAPPVLDPVAVAGPVPSPTFSPVHQSSDVPAYENPHRSPTYSPIRQPTYYAPVPIRIPTDEPYLYTLYPTKATYPTKSPVPKKVTTEGDGECDNLIANSDMELGYEGYWEETSGAFASLSTTSGYNNSKTAIRFVGAALGPSGLSYKAEENMDVSCLTSGSKWKITAQIRLEQALFGWGATCFVSRTCPQLQFYIQDSSGKVVVAISSRDYVSNSWSRNGFNELRTTFSIPSSSGLDGNVGEVSIEFGGYRGTNALILDDFSIRSVE